MRPATLSCTMVSSKECAVPPHITVEYDADRLASGDVVDFLNECGVRVAAVYARNGRW
jgi:hypothetical protein